MKVGRQNEGDWDFVLYSHKNLLAYQLRGQEPQSWTPPATYVSESPVPPRDHVIEAHYKKLQEAFPDFKVPTAPVMPNVAPFKDFPPGFADRPIVTIQTGSSCKEKDYSLNAWESVAQLLVQRGYNVAYIGGPNDPKPEYKNDRIISFIGKTDMPTTIALIRASAFHIAGDTGTGHIASAYRVPVVSVFGGFTYSESCKPFGDDKRIRVLRQYHNTENPAPTVVAFDVVTAAEQMMNGNHRPAARMRPCVKGAALGL